MNVSLIVAMAENRVIGNGDKIPWRQKADMRYFKAVTTGKPVVMGRRTWDTFPKALPRRTNIVITRDVENVKNREGCFVAFNLEEALQLAVSRIDHDDVDNNEIMIIGGAEIYAQAMPYCKRMYITKINAMPVGDVLFPEYNPHNWTLHSNTRGNADVDNQFHYEFMIFDRVGKVEKTIPN